LIRSALVMMHAYMNEVHGSISIMNHNDRMFNPIMIEDTIQRVLNITSQSVLNITNQRVLNITTQRVLNITTRRVLNITTGRYI
jgi:hypothetical protein